VTVVKGANLGLRFALELSALAATAYWGYHAADGAVRWVLAIAAPLAVIVVWALFVSPKRTVELAGPLSWRSSSQSSVPPPRRSSQPVTGRSGSASRRSRWSAAP
jgi:hypothetical protein